MQASETPLRTLIKNDADIQLLLKTVPWTLRGSLQDPSALTQALVNEWERFQETPAAVKFSLITPLWNTAPRYIQDLIASCRLQSYPNWELILVDDGSPRRDHIPLVERYAERDSRIKFFPKSDNGGISAARNFAIERCDGDYVCILDHDDILHPQILGIFARLLAANRDCTLIYSNEVKISDDLTYLSDFNSKPDFCRATLMRTNYVCHFTAVKRTSLASIRLPDGSYFQPRFDGVEDHDVFLRVSSLPGFKALHVPVFGYYWRMAPTSTALDAGVKDSVWERGKRMLLTQLPDSTDIATHPHRGGNELHSLYFQQQTRAEDVSVIVPFKDKIDMTIRCLESLELQTLTGSLRVILVDNDSSEESVSKVGQWLSRSRTHAYKVVRHAGAFNYSKINNTAVTQHCQSQRYILFLNNDVVLSSTNAIAAMIGELDYNSDMAVVGLKLLYPNSSQIQHGGMKLAQDGSKLFAPRHITGGREFVNDEHVTFAVTFACALVRKQTFDAVGGFDEDFFPNGLSDVDLCCRIATMGKKIFYMGTLHGVHLESETRKHQAEDFEIALLNEKYGSLLSRSYVTQYGYNLVSPEAGIAGAGGSFEVPLRYRVADGLNQLAKKILGSRHRRVKDLLKKGLQSRKLANSTTR